MTDKAIHGLEEELQDIILAAHRVSADIGAEVDEIVALGHDRPLDRDEAVALLQKVLTRLKATAKRRGDNRALRALAGDISTLVERLVAGRQRKLFGAAPERESRRIVPLVPRDGIEPDAVRPTPFFHGHEVPMMVGFVKTTDIELWSKNDRLEIHLGQFQQKNGRRPHGQELLDIMLSRMELPGIPTDEKDDQFKIVQLARSVAVNGVRKPPIIDLDGTLLDGNRRVAACYYILNADDEFTSEQRRKVEYIQVWQLTRHADDDDRKAVVVSLNFEDDCKEKWPEYVKARKIWEEWQAMLSAEPRTPGAERQKEMKAELSKKFALGPNYQQVNRYLKMVDWSNQFEEYHVNQKGRNEYEVKHRANYYFQYFDEIAKGEGNGVAAKLREDDSLRHLVFDLLYEGKFRNWNLIRDIKYIDESAELRQTLFDAEETKNSDEAKQKVADALANARSMRAEARTMAADDKIVRFVGWLEDLPVKAFRDSIKPGTLKRLLDALRLVSRQAKEVLGEDE